MHNFLSAKALNSAILELTASLAHKNTKQLSVTKLADLYALPVSFIKNNDKYYSLISIAIIHTSDIDTYELARTSYIFIRSGQPYYLTIAPTTNMIAPSKQMRKDLQQISIAPSRTK